MVNRSDLDAVARATVDRYLALQQEWLALDERRVAALAEANHWRDKQEELSGDAQRCYQTAALFGFDLQTLLSERQKPSARTRELELPLPTLQKVPTVKEFVLKAAHDAFPNRVRASELRKALLEQLKMEVHEKTVGMTLYRLLKDGLMKRSGIDWFYNINHGATAAEQQDAEEAEREAEKTTREIEELLG